jgi:hypothetical protein
LLVQVAGSFIEWADRFCAEPVTKINKQVEPVQAEALKQVNLQVRNQRLRLD